MTAAAHDLDPIHRSRDRVRALIRRAEMRPLDYIQWLPSQAEFAGCPDRVKLYRAGNQNLGKTTIGLAEVIWRCTGAHPFLQVPQRAIEAWIICASWSQSLAIQQKLWDLLPKDLLHPETEFDPVKGFRGTNPAVRLRSADGGWSIIRIKTTNQGGLMLAGATIDVAMFDEPPKTSRIFGEVMKRVMKANGIILLTLTPINAPTEWLRELTLSDEEGSKPLVTDLHYRLEAPLLIPEGCTQPITLRDGTPCDQEYVDRVIRETMPYEVPVVVHGEWEMRVADRIFTAFRETGPAEGRHHAHVVDVLPDEDYEIRLGIDYGHGGNFEQVAVLIGTRKIDTDRYLVVIIDEYVPEQATDINDDAAAILAMLRRNGVKWDRTPQGIRRAYGDRIYAGRMGRKVGIKSNKALMRALCKDLGLGTDYRALAPQVSTVKRGRGHGAGSVQMGNEFLHRAMVREGCFYIHRRCTRVIASLQKFDGSDNEWKHALDATRYGLDDLVFATQARRTPGRIRAW